MNDVLNSQFIIDGAQQDFTPAQMLDECNGFYESLHAEGPAIVDESIDPNPSVPQLNPSQAKQYAAAVKGCPDTVSALFPEASTKSAVADALIDSLWSNGEHTIDDISVELEWEWPVPGRIGDMAALYSSTQAAADYIGSLGIQIGSYKLLEGNERKVNVSVNGVLSGRLCPSKADVSKEDSWIVYIPFDTCAFRLGGSKLLSSLGATGSSAPQIVDADYFLDCHEVIRELVEDGVILAGATVGRKGLYPALEEFCGGCFNCSGVFEAYSQCSKTEVLFGEVPGVLIQISDDDFDYLDAELLLQDVAFYPLGHPSAGEMTVVDESENNIHKILNSIIMSAASEGED